MNALSDALNLQVTNASTILTGVVKFWVSTNIALSKPKSQYVHHADTKLPVVVLYVFGIMFLYLAKSFRHRL